MNEGLENGQRSGELLLSASLIGVDGVNQSS
jgi:hypothetical protein